MAWGDRERVRQDIREKLSEREIEMNVVNSGRD